MVGPFSPLEPVWTTMAAALAAGAPLASPSAGLLMPLGGKFNVTHAVKFGKEIWFLENIFYFRVGNRV